jgi:hypothetical protein
MKTDKDKGDTVDKKKHIPIVFVPFVHVNSPYTNAKSNCP